MSGESDPDRMVCRQATIWPPPPTVPVVEPVTDPQRQQIAAITHSLRRAALFFVGGCLTPIASWIVFGLLLRITPGTVKAASACVWPVLYISAVCLAGKACLLALRVHRPGLVIQGVIVVALSLIFIGIWFRLGAF